MILLPLAQAAQILGVHPSTLRRWADAGQIAHYRTAGGQRRFDKEELEQWLRDRLWSPNGKDSA